MGLKIGEDGLELPTKVAQEVTLILGTRGTGKCLDGDSKVLLSNGHEVPIKDIDEYPNERIICLNGELKSVSAPHTKLLSRPVKKMLRIKVRSGREIKLTPEHPLMSINGWKPASDYVKDEALATLAGDGVFWDTIVEIESLKGEFTVYDIGVPEFHNFVAENFIVHNSYSAAVFMEELNKNNVQFCCLTGDSFITLSDGREIRIDNLSHFSGSKVWALDQGELVLRPFSFKNLIKKQDTVYEISLRTGRKIRATADHPFMKVGGWNILSNLSVGDRIAVSYDMPCGRFEPPSCRARLLGYYLSEGSGGTDFGNGDATILEDFERSVREFDDNLQCKIRDIKGDNDGRKPWWGLGVASKHPVKFAIKCCPECGSSDRKKNGTSHNKCWDYVRPTYLCQNCGRQYMLEGFNVEKNAFLSMIRDIGLLGKTSHDKFVPEEVFTYTKKRLADFLQTYFSGDGGVSFTRGGPHVYCTSSSEILIRQVQSLLLRFGVQSYLRFHKGDNVWTISIWGKDAVSYIREIGFVGHGALLCEKYKDRCVYVHSNYGTIPSEIWDLVATQALASGVKKWGIVDLYKQKYGQDVCVYKHSPTPEKLYKISQLIGSAILSKFATAPIFWDEILSIQKIGVETVYDITVPIAESFVANGIIVHNCMDTLGAHRLINLPNCEVITILNGQTVNTDKLISRMISSNKSIIINVADLTDPAASGQGSKQQEICGQIANKLLIANPASKNKVIVLVVEEAEEYAPNSNAKWTAESIVPLNRLTKLGRARGCGIIFVTQRPQDFSAKLRSQVTNFIVHRLTNYTELEVMQRQLVAASRGETRPIIQRIFKFVPGEAVILSQHIPPDGIAFVKIRKRETQHAGVNILGEDGGFVPDSSSSSSSTTLGLPTVPDVPLAYGSREDLSEIIVPVNPNKMSKGDKLGIAAMVMVLAFGGITAYAVYDYYQKKRGIVFDEEEANHLKLREALFNPPKDDKKKETKDGEAPSEKPTEVTENLDDSKSSMSDPSYGVSVDTYQMEPTGNPFAYDPFSLK